MKRFKSDLFEVDVKLENGEILFDAETIAKSLGFTEKKNGIEYVMWRRINDYLREKLSAEVSKGDLMPEPLVYKLAFKASNLRAERFQDWLAIDVIPKIRKTGTYGEYDFSCLSPELQMFKQLFDAVALSQLKHQSLEGEIQQAKEEVQSIREVVQIVPYENWRRETNKIMNSVCHKLRSWEKPREQVYKALEERARCNLKRRLENMRARVLLNGIPKSTADRLNYLDVIEDDIKLIEIYTAIVKDMAIKNGAYTR